MFKVIIEALREKLFAESTPDSARGRPKKIKEETILARKNIFSAKGQKLS